jgi:methylmalonyl-CoA mutase
VVDPLGGSYLIESITNEIGMKVWKAFQGIESVGGCRKAKAAGVIESVLGRCSASREKSVATRRLVLTGTNRFANAAERALDRIDEGLAKSAGRAARTFEDLRLCTERAKKNGKLPRIVLAEIGDAKMRGARSQFVAEFLAVGGFSAEVQRFDRADQIAQTEAEAIVLCSSDQEYPALTGELMPIMKERGNAAVVLIAGNPESVAELSRLGIFDFVHLKSNAVDVISRLQARIGIED